MFFMYRRLQQLGLMLLLIVLGTSPLQADQLVATESPEVKVLTAHQTVESVTVQLMSAIDQWRHLYSENPDQFFVEIETVLGPKIDFRSILRGVMAGHYKQATSEQKARFVEAFKKSLIRTYATGLLEYNNQEIVVLPAKKPLDGKRKVIVYQEIRTDSATYPLAYTMRQSRNGSWRLINVIVNGINLGLTFRNQFAQAMMTEEGNIDKVIDNWTAEVNAS